MHREEEKVGRAQERDRLGVGQVSMRDHPRREEFARTRSSTEPGQVDLDPLSEVGPLGADGLDGLEQVDVGARDDVQARNGAAEDSPSEPDVPPVGHGKDVAGVDDSEGAVAAVGRRPREVVRVEAVRDGHDRLPPELGEPANDLGPRLGSVHDDRVGGGEQLPHPPELQGAMEPRRVDEPFVERPGVAEVRHPGDAELGGELAGGVARLEGRHGRVDEVDRPLDGAAGGERLLRPPAGELGAQAQPAHGAGPAPAGTRGLRAAHAQHLGTGGSSPARVSSGGVQAEDDASGRVTTTGS